VFLLTLMMTAPSRQMTLARMNTMGLSVAQGRRLAIVEALPQETVSAASLSEDSSAQSAPTRRAYGLMF
jgi:hypothetical protein